MFRVVRVLHSYSDVIHQEVKAFETEIEAETYRDQQEKFEMDDLIIVRDDE
jgi:hypothetical protein